MPSFTHSIPGGADTQIMQQAGNPEYVGMQPDQEPSRANAMLDGLNRAAQPEQLEPEVTQDTADDPNVTYVERLIELPNGQQQLVNVDETWGAEEIRTGLIDAGVDGGFKPDGSVTSRFLYGFGAEDNITTNIGHYAKSHYPYLINEFAWTPDTGFHIVSPEDKYGQGFGNLTPKQRRERMEQVDQQELQSKHPEVNPNNLGVAGTVGGVAKAIADPVALAPVTKAYQGVRTGMEVAKQSAKIGGTWGAAYGGSEVLAEDGAPTSLAELGTALPKVAMPAAAGAIAAPILGVPAYKVGRAVLGRVSRKVMSTPERAAKFSKTRYWPAVWERQMYGDSAGAAQRNVRKKFGISIDDEWRMKQGMLDEDGGASSGLWSTAYNHKDAATRYGSGKASNWGDPILHGSSQQWVDDFLRPLVGAVNDISPRIGRRLLDMEGNVLSKTHEYHQLFHPFMKGVKKLSKVASDADLRKFSAALSNDNSLAAKNLWLQYGLDSSAFDDMRFGLNTLSREMETHGIKFTRVRDYFPRVVSDAAGLRKQLRGKEKPTGLGAYLDGKELKLGRPLTPSEETQLINRFMSGRAGKHNKKMVGSLEKRTIHKVTNEMLPYYYDPATALEFHLRETLSKIERNKFFGQGNVKMDSHGLENITKSVGNMMREEGITGDNAKRLNSLLASRFTSGEQTGKPFLNSLRQITGGATLGNPISAVRQFGDIPSVMRTQGVTNTLISMFKTQNKELNPDVAGYMLEMAQEMDMKGATPKIRKLSQGLYKWGGFRSVDRYTKGVLIRAGLKNAQKSVKTPKRRVEFVKKYSDVYAPDELAEVIDDLANDRITDIVRSHVNAEVMRIQPISRSQMPKKYLDHPDGRIFYQFRTWGLNQIELVRSGMWRGLRSPIPSERRKAAESMVVFLAGVGATNAGISEVQKMLTGRDTQAIEDMSDDVIWQAMANFGLFDRYGIEKAVEAGDFTDYANSFIPPSLSIPGTMGLKLGKTLWGEEPVDQALLELTKETGMGRVLNYWFGTSAQEYNDKQDKKQKTEQNKNNVWAR